MHRFSHMITMLALAYTARVNADTDYSCQVTNNNANRAAMMCTGNSVAYLPCQRECSEYITLWDTTTNPHTLCRTSAYDCSGMCASEAHFSLTASASSMEAGNVSFSCCNPVGVENSLVCGTCGEFSPGPVYYKNFVVKQINSCTCGSCANHDTISKSATTRLSNLFSHTDLIAQEVTINH